MKEHGIRNNFALFDFNDGSHWISVFHSLWRPVGRLHSWRKVAVVV